jgi:hypothetical protein
MATIKQFYKFNLKMGCLDDVAVIWDFRLTKSHHCWANQPKVDKTAYERGLRQNSVDSIEGPLQSYWQAGGGDLRDLQ